ncbi:uncharacterized protein MJAP1_004328 [Malassezia japonica]|uniref:SRP54-type proteins GTP-binding domain-containing protein n=1 Tax=Malassezia japonica TaxID=223818 RepID=A0AAF0F1X8_9BASI|nr:uncharacterized protein MJAP1_004328 [Malassezia japonica]WFD41331.1 hypothetical protein MJAP1_004328 [Malassezia japonica]
MLDLFVILSKTGCILWSKAFTPSASNSDIVNRVVRTTFLEERTAQARVDIDGCTVRWTLSNPLELTFIAVYQRILQLTYVETLLESVQAAFTERYATLLKTLPSATTPADVLSEYNKSMPEWSKQFAQILRRAEHGAPKRTALEEKAANVPAEAKAAPASTPAAREAPRLGDKAVAGPGGRRIVSKSKKKGAAAAEPEPEPEPAKKPGKERRKWDANGQAIAETDVANLDFSGTGAAADESVDLSQWIDESKLGHTTKDGLYELADDDNAPVPDDEDESASTGFLSNLRKGSSTGFFSRMLGGKEALTEADLAPVLHAMQMHLQSKNVANDVAEMICDGVKRRLVGKRLATFGSIKAEVRKSLDESITRILTPRTSTDILLEIASKKQRRSELLSTMPNAARNSRGTNVSPALNPYAMCFVGVNGVGKSTNLAKVCFWLLQNRYRVLIAACDTFRSGAVEQLRTHVRNLGQLEIDGRAVSEGLPSGEALLELYERGYGKDAAGIAKDALAYARQGGFDVVLIDTAGRMQDNEPLMRALAKLIAVNQPDKVLFVGEALVGNEAVDQLTKFNRAVKDYSGVSNPRGLDGCLLTKWDTVDDKVGTALTSTWATGLPIFFVGTGQTYTDLRQLRVHHVVNALLRE